MRLNNLGVYSALLVAGLGGAYWASQPSKEGDDEKVSIFAIDAKAINEVSYKAKDVDVVAARRDDGRFWVTHTKTETPPAPKPDPAKKGAPPPAPPAAKVTTEHFLANDKMDELEKGFNPFYAARVISGIDDKQLDEFGLKDKSEVFTLKGDGGKTLTLYLGKRSYGSRSRFALEGEGGKGRVLLVDDSSFENLERAPLRMYDRRLLGFELDEVQKAELRAGDRTKHLAHTQRDKSGQILWTEDEENAAPAAPKASIGGFLDRIGKLRLASYAEPSDETTIKDVKPFLEITFEKDGKVLDHLAFVKTGGDKPVYWVTSDFLKMHAKLVNNRIEPIEKDIGQVLSDNKS